MEGFQAAGAPPACCCEVGHAPDAAFIEVCFAVVNQPTVYEMFRQLTAPAFFKIPGHVLRGRLQKNVYTVLHLHLR
jgi:hypothetical protein